MAGNDLTAQPSVTLVVEARKTVTLAVGIQGPPGTSAISISTAEGNALVANPDGLFVATSQDLGTFN